MVLEFIGADHEVTGSCHYLNAAGKHILIDYGMEQGRDIWVNADLPVPAREILVFGGADGAFELYDDSGDGYEEGITIPIRWTESRKTLILGRAAGRLPEAVRVTVRLTEPGGRHVTRQAVYDGGERRISFAEE